MASLTVSRTTTSSSPQGVLTAKVLYWTNVYQPWTRHGTQNVSVAQAVVDSLVMKVSMRKMMQLSAKIVTLSSLHQSVVVATHQLQKTTFPLLIYNGIQTVLSAKNAAHHSMMEHFLSMKDSPIVKLITML